MTCWYWFHCEDVANKGGVASILGDIQLLLVIMIQTQVYPGTEGCWATGHHSTLYQTKKIKSTFNY